ncbi:MAG: hypothetical protein WC735_03010 [Candidatus Paceibacterota bacterium]
MASLNTARIKTRLSALKEELTQFRTLLALEYSDKGSYAGLNGQINWANNPVHAFAGTCDQMYPLNSNASIYIPQANALCKKILEISSGNAQGYALHVRGDSSLFSAESWFGPEGLLYCVGSSGISFGKAFINLPGNPVYDNIGCHQNP